MTDCRTEPKFLNVPVFVFGTVLAFYCVLINFVRFSEFDDEGIILSGFHMLAAGHRLYDDVYSFYGPFYYQFYGTFYRLVGALTHDAVRAASALMMFLCVAFAALFVGRLTGSRIAMAATATFVVAALSVMPNSPGHPEGLSILLAFAMLLLIQGFERGGARHYLLLAGATVAASLAVKVNVGLFLGAALALVVCRVVNARSWVRYLTLPVAVVIVASPAAIMWPLVSLPWVPGYAVFATLVIGATVLAWMQVAVVRSVTAGEEVFTAVGFLLALGAIIGASLIGGTSLPALLEMTLFQTARFVQNWYIPAAIDRAAWTVLMIVLTGLCCSLVMNAEDKRHARVLAILADAIRAIFVLIFSVCFGAVLFPAYNPFGYFGGNAFWLLSPFAMSVLLPRRDGPPRYPVSRGALALLSAVLVLYPFPVAGHQIAIASAPFGILAAIAIHDLYAPTAVACPTPRCARGRGLWTTLTLSLFLAFVAQASAARLIIFLSLEPLDLPGARLIRVNPAIAGDLRAVTERLRECGSSYSMPGLMSFHIWAGHLPPTPLNINHPLAFLTYAQQEQVVTALASADDLCIVFFPALLERFDRGQMAARPPLLRYVLQDFVPVAEVGRYRILRRRAEADSPEIRLPGTPAVR